MNDSSPINNTDRLSVTLVFAVLFLAVLLFGVTFSYDDPVDLDVLPSMEVILIQKQTENTVEDADYLAQVSHEGGGNVDEKIRPQSTVSGPVPKPDPGEAPAPQPNTTPSPQKRTPVKVLTQAVSEQKTDPVKPKLDKPDIPQPSSDDILRRSRELAQLEAEIGKEQQAYAKRPRKKFISASTKEYEFAGYMQAWVNKIERQAGLNYPAEAAKRKLEDQLVLTVAINRTGYIESIDIIEPSKYPILNEAATLLVNLGEPYAPFPESFRDKIDVLHITRTWKFLPSGELRQE